MKDEDVFRWRGARRRPFAWILDAERCGICGLNESYAHSKEVNANGLRNRSGRRAATAMSAVRSRKNADESTLALAALCFAKAAVNACLQAERLQPRHAHWGASDA